MDDLFFLVIFCAAFGLSMLVLAIPLILQKIPPNSWYGLRTQATVDNPNLWYPANKYTGYLLLVYGVLIICLSLLLPIIPGIKPEAYSLLMAVVLLVGILIILVLGLRYVKKLTQSQVFYIDVD